MKVKASFITNSSSASFILSFRADDNMTLEEFKDIFNQYLENHRRFIKGLRFWDASVIEEVEPNSFKIVEWTSMYNNQDNIPDYMKFIMVESFLTDFYALGLKFGGFKVQHD